MNQLAQMIGRNDTTGSMTTKLLPAVALGFAAVATIASIGLG